VHTTRYQPDFNETRCILEEINRMAVKQGARCILDQQFQ
jgi:hypothetical protein